MRGLTPPSVVRQWGDALHECVCVCVLKLRLTLYTSNDIPYVLCVYPRCDHACGNVLARSARPNLILSVGASVRTMFLLSNTTESATLLKPQRVRRECMTDRYSFVVGETLPKAAQRDVFTKHRIYS